MCEEADIPQLKVAKAYTSHRKYSAALDIYTEVLPTLPTDSATYNIVLLEYAKCLLENVNYQVEMGYRRVLQKTGKGGNEEEINEDLEICWDSLEVCRVAFESSNDRKRLCQTHKGLGDVLALNNDFEEAAKEYTLALEFAETAVVSDLCMCIAECYRDIKNCEKAKEFYIRAAEGYESTGDLKQAQEARDIAEVLESVHFKESIPEKVTESPGEARDINYLKKK